MELLLCHDPKMCRSKPILMGKGLKAHQDMLTRLIFSVLNAKSKRNRDMGRLLGDCRLNRPYPDPDLVKHGVMQELPIEIKTPFKWLISEPFYPKIGSDREFLFVHAQKEGGQDWLGTEIECRDMFILLKRDHQGRYKEINSIMLNPFEGQFVYRIVDLELKEDHTLSVKIENGTYNFLKNETKNFFIEPWGFRYLDEDIRNTSLRKNL